MMIELKKNLVVVTFNKSIDIIDLIIILHYYINNKDCIISKVLLIANKNHLKWYNDITPYVNKNLLLLYTKIKSNTSDIAKVGETHFSEEDINIDTILEIHTVNRANKAPKIISKKEMLDIMYADWVKQL